VTWPRIIVIAIAIGISLGVAALATVRAGGDGLIKSAALFVLFVHGSFSTTAGLAAPMFAIATAVGGAASAGVLAGLAGALSGATGAAVERRLFPNQVIRQSAVNVMIFRRSARW
jgi:hypothetical protein